ncbi:unnamed protein product [Moneuplotes crassus]|uniref:Uncharacterized protein n=1 Tax=Euplotes crassus TaxID=5936 RepID=A0AAD1UTE1_EUPCR|nr:unnamed protein product [Moneuplotes crassus]
MNSGIARRINKYCRTSNTPADSLGQRSYSSLNSNCISKTLKEIGWGCTEKKHSRNICYIPTKFTNGFPNYNKTSSLKKLKDFAKIKSSAPDCVDTGKGTYKDTLNELDALAKVRVYKARKCINIPGRIPFEHLDLRKKKRIIKSLSRFEIVKAGKPPRKVKKQSLKALMNGSYLKIQMSPQNISLYDTLKSQNLSTNRDSRRNHNKPDENLSPVPNKFSIESSYSLTGTAKKSKRKDASNELQFSARNYKENVIYKSEQYKGIFKKALKVQANAIMQESTQAFLKKKFYKNMVPSRKNKRRNQASVYNTTCARCKKDSQCFSLAR